MRVVREVRTLYSLKKITQTPARAIVGAPSPHQTCRHTLLVKLQRKTVCDCNIASDSEHLSV
jgi:hypothetical protein